MSNTAHHDDLELLNRAAAVALVQRFLDAATAELRKAGFSPAECRIIVRLASR